MTLEELKSCNDYSVAVLYKGKMEEATIRLEKEKILLEWPAPSPEEQKQIGSWENINFTEITDEIANAISRRGSKELFSKLTLTEDGEAIIA